MDNLQAFTISDFSGGLTDNLVGNAPNRFAVIDNLLINTNQKAYQRWGSVVYDDSHHTVLASGNPRIGALVNFDNSTKLFAQIAKNIYHKPSSWSSLLGPSSNACFNNGSSTSYASFSEWNKHLYAVNDAYSYPTKIFVDVGGTTRLRTAGLPNLDLFAAISLANEFRTDYIAHIANTSRHPVADSVNTITAPAASDLFTLITLVTELCTDYNAHALDADAGTPTYHTATAATSRKLFQTTAPRTLSECIERLDDLKTKYNLHEATATPPHNGTSANAVTTSRSLSIATAGTGFNYIYAFVWVYEYTVGNLKYIDFGPVKQVAFSKTAAIDAGSPATISNFAPFAIANGSIFNWDTANLYLRIYRTINNGDTFYWVEDQVDTTASNTRVGYVANSAISGATTYVDGATDAIIQAANKQLYINGGVLDNDQPPPCKFIHITDNFAYYGYIKEGTDEFPSRVYQSSSSDPDSVPGANFVDLEDEVVGISSFNSIPIVFCKRFVYRLDGFYDDLGRGQIQPLKIINAPGCVGNQSIVQAAEGVFYAGLDGFYWTDGYQVTKVSDEWNETYKDLVSTSTKQKRIIGCYEEQERKIHWGIQYDDSSSDNDRIITLDLRWGIKRDSCFTTWSNSTHFAPTALVVYDKLLVRGDRRGYLFKHQETTRTDPKVDTATTPDNWEEVYIPFRLKTVHYDFGDQKNRKFVPRITFIARNRTNLSLTIASINDQGKSTQNLREVRFRGNNTWGDELLVWGDDSLLWGQDGEIAVWMRFPAGQLRCQHKQLEFTNAFTIITNSDTLGTATISNAANTITLDNASAKFPSNSVDYYISHGVDNYGAQFLVTAINSPTNTALTLQDVSNVLPTGAGLEWLLKGYKKEEAIEFDTITVQAIPLSRTQQQYTGDIGENA